jgi:hypothetical protein
MLPGRVGRMSTWAAVRVMAESLALPRNRVRVEVPPGAMTAGENCLLRVGGEATTTSALVASSLLTPSLLVTPPLAMRFT